MKLHSMKQPRYVTSLTFYTVRPEEIVQQTHICWSANIWEISFQCIFCMSFFYFVKFYLLFTCHIFAITAVKNRLTNRLEGDVYIHVKILFPLTIVAISLLFTKWGSNKGKFIVYLGAVLSNYPPVTIFKPKISHKSNAYNHIIHP